MCPGLATPPPTPQAGDAAEPGGRGGLGLGGGPVTGPELRAQPLRLRELAGPDSRRREAWYSRTLQSFKVVSDFKAQRREDGLPGWQRPSVLCFPWSPSPSGSPSLTVCLIGTRSKVILPFPGPELPSKCAAPATWGHLRTRPWNSRPAHRVLGAGGASRIPDARGWRPVPGTRPFALQMKDTACWQSPAPWPCGRSEPTCVSAALHQDLCSSHIPPADHTRL